MKKFLGIVVPDSSWLVVVKKIYLIINYIYLSEFPKKYFNDFLDYVNITEENFWQVVDSWRSEHLWSFVGNQWTLNYPLK